jgi:selenide,water dikinase
MAADMQGEASAAAVEASYDSMLQSNQHAMQQLHRVSPNAVTDVTGFGLIGHLLEMLDSANKKADYPLLAELNLSAIPMLTGAIELVEGGWRSSLYPQLEPYLSRCMFGDQKEISDQLRLRVGLLLDPQTSGGLLATISEANAVILLEGQRGASNSGYGNFVVIGKIKQKPSKMNQQISISLMA